MCFGGNDAPRTSTVVNKTVNEIPQWLQEAGEEAYQTAKPISERDYPVYGEPRVAEFSPETQQSFDMAKDATGAWRPSFEAAFSQTQQGAAPVGAEDIDRYMNPYTQQVIDSTIEDMQRQARRDQIERNAGLVRRGSYMNEDRRAVIDNLANESLLRSIGSTAGSLRMKGFQDALSQANTDKNRVLQGAVMNAELAPLQSQLLAGDTSALAQVGTAKESKEQQNLGLRYEDFLNQFYYPQEQLNWLTSIMQGAPYASSQTTTGQQPYATSNPFSQGLGAFATAAGALGGLGWRPFAA